jgi:hypothetical protein
MHLRSRHAASSALVVALAVRAFGAAAPNAYPEDRAREYAAAAGAFAETCFLREKLKFLDAVLARRAAYDPALADACAERRAAAQDLSTELRARISGEQRAWRVPALPGAADPAARFAALAADAAAFKERARPLFEWARAQDLRIPEIPEQPHFRIALREKLRFGVLVRDWRYDAFPAWRALGFDHVAYEWRELPRRGADVDTDALARLLGRNAEFGYRTFLRHAADGPVAFSLWQDAPRARARQDLRQLGKALGAHEALLGYALYCGADFRPFAEERGADGARAVRAFQAFLERRYATVDLLNAAWRTTYRDFAAIAGPPGARLKDYGPIVHDFGRFRQESMQEFLDACVRALAESDARHPVLLALDERAGTQDAFLAASLPGSFVVSDARPGGTPGADFREAQAAGIARAAQKQLWRDRFVCTAPERALGTDDADTLGAAINRNIWEALAGGARGILFFALDGAAPGADDDTLLDRDSAWRIIRPESARIGLAIGLARALEAELLDSTAEEPEIGILDSPRSRLLPSACAAQREARAAVERVLAEEGWSSTVLPDASLVPRPESWHKLRAIVAPGCPYVLGESAATLERYVATGGTLIVTGRGTLLDERGDPTALSRLLLAKRRAVGRGSAYRIEDLPAERDALVALLARAVGQPRVAVAPRGAVRTFLRRNAKGARLFLVNASAREPVEALVTLNFKIATARDLVVGAAVPVERADGARALRVPLEPGGVAVLELGTK